MSQPKDFDPILRSSENVPMSPEEQAVWQAEQNIEDHIKDETQDSALWKAFADYTDYEEVNFLMRFNTGLNSGNEVPYEFEVRLINETIRKRTNETPGYKRHFEKAEELGFELYEAVEAKNKTLDNEAILSSRISRFKAIKDRAIDRFDQRFTTPRMPSQTK